MRCFYAVHARATQRDPNIISFTERVAKLPELWDSRKWSRDPRDSEPKNDCAGKNQQQFTQPNPNQQVSLQDACKQWQFMAGCEESILLAAAT
jgi:hypothetical protein